MKKYIFYIFLILVFLIFQGCRIQKLSKKMEVEIKQEKISPFIPLRISVKEENKVYKKYKIYIDGKEYGTFEKGEAYIKIEKEGTITVSVEILNEKNDILSKISKEIYYDKTPPVLDKVSYNLISGRLIVRALSSSKDFSYFLLKGKNIRKKFTYETDIELQKNKGIQEFEIYAVDNVLNQSTPTLLVIDTSKDLPPKILNKKLNVSIFGKSNLEVVDDWDNESELKITFSTSNKNYTPLNLSDILTDNSTKVLIVVKDTQGNFSTKEVPLEKEKEILDEPSGNPRLVASELKTIAWKYDENIYRYVVENPKDKKWRVYFETIGAFARVSPENVIMIRKKSKFGSLGFPSVPTFRFSGKISPGLTGIMETTQENLTLFRINSPFVIASNVLVKEKASILIESGSEIRFLPDSKLIVKGVLFVMPGVSNTLFTGSGEIIIDGGILIASRAVFDGVKVVGHNATLIFLEDSFFVGESEFESNYDERVCLYKIYGKNSQFLSNGSLEVFIKASVIGDLEISNISRIYIKESEIEKLKSRYLNKIAIFESKVEKFDASIFSWVYSYKNTIKELNVVGFSRFIDVENNIEKSREYLGVVIR